MESYLEAPLNTIYTLQRNFSEEEVKRGKQFHFEKDRLHWLVAHGILRTLLGHYLHIDPRKVRFLRNDYGKPFIAYPPTCLQYLEMMTNMPIGHPFRRPAVLGELPYPLLLAPIAKGRSYFYVEC